MHLHFEQLMADYERRLIETLRGFSLGAEFLETWVPTEDATDSALDLVEHARLHGLQSIEIAFETGQPSAIDFERLIASAAQHGQASLKKEGSKNVLSVCFNISGKDQSEETEEGLNEVNPLYRSQLRRFAKDLCHEGAALKATAPEVIAMGEVDGVRLTALINPTNDVIRVMHHEGGKTRAEMTALDRLCQIGEGLPMQELADHGVLRLEHGLRALNVPTKVEGILIPERMDPLFVRAMDLVRKLAKDYCGKTGRRSIDNFYDHPVGPEWRTLAPEARKQRAAEALASHASEIGIDTDEARVVDTLADTRVVVELAATMERWRRPQVLRAVESVIRRAVDPHLEVVMPDRKDENKLRRL